MINKYQVMYSGVMCDYTGFSDDAFDATGLPSVIYATGRTNALDILSKHIKDNSRIMPSIITIIRIGEAKPEEPETGVKEVV